MEYKYQSSVYRHQKQEIAQNLIDIFEKDERITTQARRFISDWILTGPEEKGKVFFDVWDIVLKSFLPTTRPILFRACDRISKNGKIASFTGSLECARRFSKGKGSLIICDTTKTIAFDEYFKKAGEYNHTFYPLANLLVKAKDSGGWEFSERILNDYSAEDEYIMRINLDHMHSVKWLKTNRQL